MKLQADRIEGVNVVTGLAPGKVTVNRVAYQQSILIPWQGEVTPWGRPHFDALGVADFQLLADMNPELVIFGSGSCLRFPPPALLRPLIERAIGVETMDSAAACRTYNLLASEGRRVVAALLLEPASTP